MKLQPARLGTDSGHALQGSAIDRSRPLQFRLDGRTYAGFAGDTILSAVMAAGVDTAGQRGGLPIALTTRHAPAIAPADHAESARHALPMERTPATEGASYVTLATRLARNPLTRLLGRNRHSLGLNLERPDTLPRPWLGQIGTAGPEADLVVVGGGVAGMSAALAGARRGLRTVLVDCAPSLGGHAPVFGRLDGEERAEEAIARLRDAIAASSGITVLTASEVFALRPGKLRLHQVVVTDNVPVGRVLDLAPPHIVLATGALERLPVFSGNRLPGVIGALEAFELARLYGVWAGRTALLATSSSPAYRIAMLARDAGIDMVRIIDSRAQPQSRFIEFSRAYGITQAASTMVASVLPTDKGRGLMVSPQPVMEGLSAAEPAIPVDRLLVCGGWQPDLTLWHTAGGESRWNAEAARLEPTVAPPGIALAGSAAGWSTRSACLASGTDSVDRLLGREGKTIADDVIDPLYETPDAAAPVGDLAEDDGHPAYLNGGHGYLDRPRPLPVHRPRWLPIGPRPKGWSLAETAQPLDIAEVAAGVQLGAIPAASAGIVAQERVAMVTLSTAEPSHPVEAQAFPPAYLIGRNPGAELFVVTTEDKRMLNIGALIYLTPDDTDPLSAIGTVVRNVDGVALALASGTIGQSASARDAGAVVPVTLAAPWRDGMDLGAALGRGASAL